VAERVEAGLKDKHGGTVKLVNTPCTTTQAESSAVHSFQLLLQMSLAVC